MLQFQSTSLPTQSNICKWWSFGIYLFGLSQCQPRSQILDQGECKMKCICHCQPLPTLSGIFRQGKAGSLHLEWSSIKEPTLPENTRLGWKWLKVTNAVGSLPPQSNICKEAWHIYATPLLVQAPGLACKYQTRMEKCTRGRIYNILFSL